MITITLDQPGCFRAGPGAPPAQPGPGQALVQVHRVGICGTDLHAFRGRQPFFTYPRVLGHELGVEVVSVGPGVRAVAPGDRCAVEPYLHCGRCIACRRDKPNCCANLQVLGVHTDGGMQPWLIVPADKLHRSDQLTLDQLALVETLGIGAHAVDRAQLAADDTVLVVGAGPIGLSVLQFVRAARIDPVIMDISPARLRFCQQQLGFTRTLDAAAVSESAVRDRFDGELPTVVFDATGNAASMLRSFDWPAPGGRLVFVGLVQDEIRFNDPQLHRRELTLLASRNSTPADFARIVGMIELGQIDTTPWITHRTGCEQMIEQFPAWLDPASSVIKAMVNWT